MSESSKKSLTTMQIVRQERIAANKAKKERFADFYAAVKEGLGLKGYCGWIYLKGDKVIIERPDEDSADFGLGNSTVSLVDIKTIEFVESLIETVLQGSFGILRLDLTGVPRRKTEIGLFRGLALATDINWRRHAKTYHLDNFTVVFKGKDLASFRNLKDVLQKRIDEARSCSSAPSPSADVSESSASDMLVNIKKLHDKGILSDDEYEQKRKKYLEQL